MRGSPARPGSQGWSSRILTTLQAARLRRRREGRVLPDHGGALADADAHGGEPVADLRVLGELPRQLGHQPYAGGCERVPGRDRPAPRVDPRIVVADAEMVEEGEHLHGEGLIELEQPDVLDG